MNRTPVLTAFRIPASYRKNGSLAIHEGYEIVVRTATGDETHTASIGSSRTSCGCRVAAAVARFDAPVTCEKCATSRQPMTPEEVAEAFEVAGYSTRTKNRDAGRFVADPNPEPPTYGETQTAKNGMQYRELIIDGEPTGRLQSYCPQCQGWQNGVALSLSQCTRWFNYFQRQHAAGGFVGRHTIE